MSNLRTTSDIVDEALAHAGELTDGTSSFEAAALRYLNNIHKSLISGGNEFGIDIDEPWDWAKAEYPIILELQPAYETGTVTLTLGSTSGTLSVAPTYSVQGWYLKIDSRDEHFRIANHSASSTSIQLDTAYTEASGTFNFTIFKLDYQLSQDLITIDSRSDVINFSETSGVELTATLTTGVYTPSGLATEIKTQLEAVGANTYTVTWDSVERLFTISSNGSTLEFLFGTGTDKYNSAAKRLGFESKNYTGAVSYTSPNPINAIDKLVAPMNHYRDHTFYESSDDIGKIFEVSFSTMTKRYPQKHVEEKVPDVYCVMREYPDGSKIVRFNAYPDKKTKVEVEYVPIPDDLHDNAGSVPLVPRAHRKFLVLAVAYYLMLDKSDNRAQVYEKKAAEALRGMFNAKQKQRQKAGDRYGQIKARPDQIKTPRRLY